MPKVPVSPARRARRGWPLRSRASRAVWVRKNIFMDQKKLNAARRTLGVDSDTEAIDMALDFIAFRRELARGIAAIRRSGGIDDLLEDRQQA